MFSNYKFSNGVALAFVKIELFVVHKEKLIGGDVGCWNVGGRGGWKGGCSGVRWKGGSGGWKGGDGGGGGGRLLLLLFELKDVGLFFSGPSVLFISTSTVLGGFLAQCPFLFFQNRAL